MNYPMMMAPGAAASAPLRLPGARAPRPLLDDHLMPEDSRVEIVNGQRFECMANEEHAEPQTRFSVVLYSAAAPGYGALVELTTRHDFDNDFTSDVCLKRHGQDPRTGERYLEELAFEIANEESLGHLRTKARKMSGRGVRRVFGLLVKKGRMMEWRADRDDFELLALDGVIEDPCLLRPLPIKALLDAAAADEILVQALDAKQTPALVQIRREERLLGRLLQGREMLLKILYRRGFSVPPDLRDRILGAADQTALDRWAEAAITAASLGEVFSL